MKTSALVLGGVTVGLAVTSLQGCGEDGPLGNLPEQCGLVCAAEGVAQGNASISGVASVDAFFGAVVTFGRVTTEISGGINAELQAIALSLELEPGAAAADIRAALEAKISGAVSGGLQVKYAPPRCEVSVEATIEATAKCDATVDPGKAEVQCEGTCEVDASAMASCDASATVKCVGTAPNLECSGSCRGDCQLDVAAACEGTCRGDCQGTCSVQDAQGNCAGSCDGMCKGTCEISGGGSCSGKCSGECEYTPPDAKCEAGAQVRCEAAADASASCKGRCDGEVQPPKASAECEAAAKAEANASVQCYPPSLEITWQWSGQFKNDVDAQAEFKAWVEVFRVRFAALVAATKRAELVVQVGADLTAAAEGAVKGAVEVAGDGEVDLKTGVGLTCALGQLDAVGGVIADGSQRLQGSLSGALEVTGAITGG